MTPAVAVVLGLAAVAPAADPPTPLPVAHRGLATHAPENTEAAVRACVGLHLGCEIDVRRAKSGELVCVHDDTVDRTTDGTGKVADLTAEQLGRLDAGAWFHPTFRGQWVPHLGELLGLAARTPRVRPALFALDLKAFDDRLAADLARVAKEEDADPDRLVCIGLAIADPAVRKALHAATPRLPSAVLAQTAADLPAAVADPHAGWVYVRFVPTAAEVARCRAAGKKVFAAGPKFAGREADSWAAAAAAGVDAVLTDYPLELRAATRPAAGKP